MIEIKHSNELKDIRKRLALSLVFPLIFIILIWLVWIFENGTGDSFHTWGLFPRKISGLKGIIFSPFIHGDLNHIVNNSVPLLVLMTSLFYFYSDLAPRIFLLTWLMAGIWVWFGGREAYHIGASGLIYGMAAFLFLSGVIRNHIPLLAISLLVVFLYGSMVWGVLPIREEISWESHLLGALAGIILAVHYRHFGPQKKEWDWGDEEDHKEFAEESGEMEINAEESGEKRNVSK